MSITCGVHLCFTKTFSSHRSPPPLWRLVGLPRGTFLLYCEAVRVKAATYIGWLEDVRGVAALSSVGVGGFSNPGDQGESIVVGPLPPKRLN